MPIIKTFCTVFSLNDDYEGYNNYLGLQNVHFSKNKGGDELINWEFISYDNAIPGKYHILIWHTPNEEKCRSTSLEFLIKSGSSEPFHLTYDKVTADDQQYVYSFEYNR